MLSSSASASGASISARRPDAIGQTLSVNGARQRVVAVLPDAFEDPLVSGVEIWAPLDLQGRNRTQWYNHYLSVVGRLRQGATLEQAQAELKTIAAQIESNYGRSSVRRWARVTPLQVDTVGTAGSMLWMLLGAVGLLLTIACVNVAGLVLARGAAREQEVAVRAALGCSRWRLARQLIIESVLLSLAGGIVGLMCAQVVTRLLLAAAPESVARVAATAANSGSCSPLALSWRSSPASHSDSRRPCSMRARTSRACCASQGAAAAAAAGKRDSGRSSSSVRSPSRSCCSPAPACSCAVSSGCRSSISD